MNNKMKKAQIQSQVIVYILAVVIMGMIFVFGYQALQRMQNTACEVNRIEFLTDIKADIDIIGSGYGDSKQRTYRLTCGDYRQVCFVNLDHVNNDPLDICMDGENDVLCQLNYMNDLWQGTYGAEGKEVKPIILNAVEDMIPVYDPYTGALLKPVAARNNMFLCPPCTEQDYVGNISIKNETDHDVVFRCYELKQGKMYMTITGRGNLAVLSNGLDQIR